MRWFWAAGYDYGRGPAGQLEVHGFVLDKPSRIRQHLITADVAAPEDFEEPDPVDRGEVAGVHEEVVAHDLHDPYAVSRAMEFDAIALLPQELVWRAVVAPQLHAAGGTLAALRAALEGDWAANLSGGFHHARPDLSHGFCLINDVALAVHRLREEGASPRLLIVDLDLHQGDGNATFFAKDDRVFTFSMHEQGAFPADKVASDLDAGLPPGMGDEDYLAQLESALAQVRGRFRPEILIYVAGSDPFVRDPLGSLRLTLDGMLERDRRVAHFAAELCCPLVALPAGGYSEESPSLTAAGLAEIAAMESGGGRGAAAGG